MRLKKLLPALLLVLALVIAVSLRAATRVAAEGEAYAIEGGTVVTVTGETIKDGVVVVRNGLIESVGANGSAGANVPADARVIDAKGMMVYPGLFDSYTGYGIRPAPTPTPGPGAGGGNPLSAFMALMAAPPSSVGLLPEVTVVDQLQIGEETFDGQRAAGITTALTAPRTGIFQGQSALINLGSDAAEKLILKAPVSLNVGFASARGGYPNSLMGVFAFLRQSLLDAQHYRDEWARYNKAPRGAQRPQVNKSLAALQPVINGELPVIFNVTTVREIKRAVALAEEFNLKYMLAGATQSYATADFLKAKNATVILSLSFPQKPLGLEDPEDEALRTLRDRAEAPKAAAALQKAGVRFVFTSGTLARSADYIANAARAIEAGLPKDEALKAMTIYPAQVFGVGEQLGSIEKGKIANLVVASGDLFDKNTKVKYVFVDGKYFEPKAPAPTMAGVGPGGRFGGRPGGAQPNAGDATASAAAAAGVSAAGSWKILVNTPMGTRELMADLQQNGEAVTGSLQSQFGMVNITSGRFANGELTLEVTMDLGGRTVPGKLTGRINGNEITGTMNIMGRDSEINGTRIPK